MVNPWKTYVKLSAVLMGSHGLTKGSLAYLNYPAQLMFKSTKVWIWIVLGISVCGVCFGLINGWWHAGAPGDDNGSFYTRP